MGENGYRASEADRRALAARAGLSVYRPPWAWWPLTDAERAGLGEYKVRAAKRRALAAKLQAEFRVKRGRGGRRQRRGRS